ncbi:response regulator [Limimaricola hongkongensis]|uniref:Two-component response regulator n=1 Tax=Limimaricola hongkongensis DSM 17492 TaxID=1122180 RepID=A0A017HDY4_9RHOB|nr:response regulator [Limimaricola hongkongensis]EYD72510.1 two-component response regulator [Limimaricola hongkongensis DSM 17492]
MKILFVDNEEDIVSLVEIALEIEDDIDLTTATSGTVGFELIDATEFDGFVFDLMMPEPDGRAMLGRVRGSALNRDKPVIMCTAKAEASAADDLRRAGATAVIAKPFDPLSFATTIRQLIKAA